MGFGDRWLISVMMRFGASGLSQINSSVNALNRNIDKTAMAAAKLRGIGTGIAATFAVMGGAIIGYGVTSAAKFQLAMATVGMTVKATGTQLKNLSGMAINMSDITAQSQVTIAQEMAVAVQGGLGSYARLHALFPLLAKFADVQYFQAKGKGREFSPQDAVSYGVQFAHMFQAYTPEKMANMLEWITKLTQVTAESPNRALTQAKYFVPMGHALGLTDEQVFTILGMMGQTGFLRGKGGTSIENTLLGTIRAATLTSHSQAKQKEGLMALGILDSSGRNTILTAGGKMDFGKLDALLSADAAKMKPSDFVGALVSGLGKQATQFDAVLFQPDVQKQMQFVENQYASMGSKYMEAMFAVYQQQFLVTVQRVFTNLQNTLTLIFGGELPSMTAKLDEFGQSIHRFNLMLEQHPESAHFIAQLIEFVTALSALRFLAGFLGNATGIVSAVKLLGMRSAAGELMLGGLGSGIASVGAPLLAGALGFGALIYEMMRPLDIPLKITAWWRSNKFKIGYAIGYVFGSISSTIVAALKFMLSAITAAFGAFRSNMWMALTNREMFSKVEQAAIEASLKGSGNKGGFFQGLQTGGIAGMAHDRFGGYEVKAGDTHIQNSFMLAPGTPEEIANEAMKKIAGSMASLRSTMRSQGTQVTSPHQPAGDKLWGMLYPTSP